MGLKHNNSMSQCITVTVLNCFACFYLCEQPDLTCSIFVFTLPACCEMGLWCCLRFIQSMSQNKFFKSGWREKPGLTSLPAGRRVTYKIVWSFFLAADIFEYLPILSFDLILKKKNTFKILHKVFLTHKNRDPFFLQEKLEGIPQTKYIHTSRTHVCFF